MESDEEKIDKIFDTLIEQLRGHEKYGPAVADNAAKNRPFVLNYHTHGQGQPYCVAIATFEQKLLPVINQSPPLRELAHIKGIGQTKEQCLPLMSVLAQKLKQTYSLEKMPEIYLNSRPV